MTIRPSSDLTGCPGVVVLKTQFDDDPSADGWQTGGPYGGRQNSFQGQWTPHCITIEKGLWQTPSMPVEPHAYYRVEFRCRSKAPNYHVFRFFDVAGTELTADDHNAVETTPDWQLHTAFTQARADAASMRLAFAAGTTPLQVAEVTISQASADDVLAWSDAVYRTLPPVTYEPPADRWAYLQNTQARLQRGDELEILILGDSIANDLGNSQFHLMIQSHYPGATVKLLRSVRGGTGCTFYAWHVAEYILVKSPDLIMIGGISHHCSAASIRRAVEQTRAASAKPVDVLAMTGAVGQPGMNRLPRGHATAADLRQAREQALAREARFFTELHDMASDLGIATLDMRSVWEDYMSVSGQPRAWYQRDRVHANTRGKQVLGRIIERFFTSPRPF